MKIALLGYGKEGKAVENYFKTKSATFDIFENFTPTEIGQKDFSFYDLIFRSPSVPPLNLKNESSVTKYFFDHCPCPIIGVTATKGKGTICSFIKAILDALGEDAHLVGNIGTPAIDVLDQLQPTSIVIYELSSFQLWDLEQSPHIAILGQLEPDHLNVHKDYQDYLNAKTNITRYQTADDYLVYCTKNPETQKIAENSIATKVPYPFNIPDTIKAAIKLPGLHNEENAIAAIAAIASYKNLTPHDFIEQYQTEITTGISNFKGLPHHLELVRTINQTRYYDDNFSTTPSSTRVAIKAFPNDNLVIILGGRDKTNNQDLPEIYEILSAPQIKKIILIGESGHELTKLYHDSRFILAESLAEAVNIAQQFTADLENAVVLMSPAAASFDMFENASDRGAKFQQIVKNL